ncbi:MAG: hypoxanthine-guanine phosphoribosyltransferase, partial [Gammaproteobacteria bacterium]
DLRRTRAEADCLDPGEEVAAAADRMAAAITARLRNANPLLLVTMTGGLFPAALLLARLDFPLQVDYVHLTRYGTATSGGTIEWRRRPAASVAGRTVLLVDDLLDHGLTLAAAVDELKKEGAREVLTAVLVVKRVAARPGLARVDFYALETPDRYLFGAGMDYKTYWRNCAGIYAVKGL